MCTLIVAHRIFDHSPIVVAANRDEQLDRPSEPPQKRDREFGIFSPLDLQRGGTWIGVNAYGVFAGLTNRMDIKSHPNCRSRGEIVMKALHSHSAEEAFRQTQRWDGKPLNGFNLVIADASHLFLVQGNGQTIARSQKYGVLVTTNQGVGQFTDLDNPKRVRHILQKAAEQKTFSSNCFDLEKLKRLLQIHGGIYGTCIIKPESNYGTKSSSIIRLSLTKKVWSYWHRERTKEFYHICMLPFSTQTIIPLNHRP